MSDYVRCSRCGKRVSNDVPVELTVRAWVECPECVEAAPTSDADLALSILRRLVEDDPLTYLTVDADTLVVDGIASLTEAERALIERLAGKAVSPPCQNVSHARPRPRPLPDAVTARIQAGLDRFNTLDTFAPREP